MVDSKLDLQTILQKHIGQNTLILKVNNDK